MKEREPNFEDEKILAWLRKPQYETWEGLDEDPTVMTIDEETEEIFESRTYRLRPTPEAFSLVLDILRVRMGEQLEQMPSEMLANYAASMVDDTLIKFLAKRRKEDGRITHLLVAITGGSRRLLDGREWEEEKEYRQTVECFEELPFTRAILSPPVVIALEGWRRYAEEGPISRRNLEAAAGELDLSQNDT